VHLRDLARRRVPPGSRSRARAPANPRAIPTRTRARSLESPRLPAESGERQEHADYGDHGRSRVGGVDDVCRVHGDGRGLHDDRSWLDDDARRGRGGHERVTGGDPAGGVCPSASARTRTCGRRRWSTGWGWFGSSICWPSAFPLIRPSTARQTHRPSVGCDALQLPSRTRPSASSLPRRSTPLWEECGQTARSRPQISRSGQTKPRVSRAFCDGRYGLELVTSALSRPDEAVWAGNEWQRTAGMSGAAPFFDSSDSSGCPSMPVGMFPQSSPSASHRRSLSREDGGSYCCPVVRRSSHQTVGVFERLGRSPPGSCERSTGFVLLWTRHRHGRAEPPSLSLVAGACSAGRERAA
jgi:hypothetical protein